MVNISIALFVISTFLYYQAVSDVGVSSAAVNLLPQFTVVTVVALIFFHQLVLAYAVLVGGVLIMALTVAAFSLYRLFELERTSLHDRKLDAFVV